MKTSVSVLLTPRKMDKPFKYFENTILMVVKLGSVNSIPNSYAKIYKRRDGRAVIYFNREVSQRILKNVKSLTVAFEQDDGFLLIYPEVNVHVKRYKIQKRLGFMEVTLPKKYIDYVEQRGLFNIDLPVIIDKNLIAIPFTPGVGVLKPELVKKVTGFEPIIITLIGSRFWRCWKVDLFKQLRNKWDDADYDFFTVYGIPSIKYTTPCIKINNTLETYVLESCVNEAVESKIRDNVDLKGVSFRKLNIQLLKSNANYVYYLTSDVVYINEYLKKELRKYFNIIPQILNKRKFLLSLYGATVGSSRSSEGQTSSKKSAHRHINALNFAILTIYFYHNQDLINKKVIFRKIRDNFAKICDEVLGIVNPNFTDDILYYAFNLRDKIMQIKCRDNIQALSEFSEIIIDIQRKIDDLYR